MAGLELKRIVSEWRNRFQRVAEILNPPVWSEQDWRFFAVSLSVLVRQHGATWEHSGNRYWDLRWHVREGGELVCQLEQKNGGLLSIVVAQTGGFAGTESYVWMWCELNGGGEFAREPYTVEGMWKDALAALLVPISARAGFYLADRAESPPMAALGNSVPPAAEKPGQ